jgi:hypothetical protein
MGKPLPISKRILIVHRKEETVVLLCHSHRVFCINRLGDQHLHKSNSKDVAMSDYSTSAATFMHANTSHYASTATTLCSRHCWMAANLNFRRIRQPGIPTLVPSSTEYILCDAICAFFVTGNITNE